MTTKSNFSLSLYWLSLASAQWFQAVFVFYKALLNDLKLNIVDKSQIWIEADSIVIHDNQVHQKLLPVVFLKWFFEFLNYHCVYSFRIFSQNSREIFNHKKPNEKLQLRGIKFTKSNHKKIIVYLQQTHANWKQKIVLKKHFHNLRIKKV